MRESEVDIVIVGGGLVGTVFACALAKTPFNIALIDATPAHRQVQSELDVRKIALSLSSHRILQSLGLWESLQSSAHPMKHIHISDQGHFGKTRLHASDHRLDALGYVMELSTLQSVFNEHVQQLDNVTLYKPAKVTQLCQTTTPKITAQMDDDLFTITSQCLVAADGTNSFIRSGCGIDTEVEDYQQTAIVTNVKCSHPHQDTAYERFTQSGPLALLPLGDHRMAVVYTVKTDQVDEVMALNDDEFLCALQSRFGYHVGAFTTVGKRQSYPLQRKRAVRDVCDDIVLVGNAARTVHPITAQGFNLGLRDVAVLSDLIRTQGLTHVNALLKTYQDMRSPDQDRILNFTDNMIRIFCHRFFPHTLLRNIGLMGLNVLPGLKKRFTQRAMGFSHTKSQLLTGVNREDTV